jgi:hypothetical protein
MNDVGESEHKACRHVQTSLNDLDKAEEASKLRSSELAAYPLVSDPASRIAD